MDDSFITGFDISSYIAEIESGAKFYDFDGNELDEEGFFKFLSECGVSHVRIRIWNDPYDENHNGYGGGNNDLETAIRIGKDAASANIKVIADFHCSDFWADPSKQMVPKAWKNISFDDKCAAMSTYISESVKALKDAGVLLDMVQIGNETNRGLAGETGWKHIGPLFAAGASAVRSVDPNILIAVHYTDPHKNNGYSVYAKKLAENNVDYDVFASSYYPYWHGSLDNLTEKLKEIADEYQKKVMVLETSWAYTLSDGDGHPNTVAEGSNDTNMPFEFSVQGQATEISAVTRAVTDVGDAAIGICYWEPAWIPVDSSTWETNGSGWATSYAGDYDPNDAGKYYGGNAVDNQALFDFEGHPLESILTYKYMRTGTTAPKVVSKIIIPDVTCQLSDVSAECLTGEAEVIYNNNETVSCPITWDSASIDKAVASGIGEYTIPGTCKIDKNDTDVTIKLSIVADNYLKNPGFEDELNDWTVTGFDTKDASSNSLNGIGSIHFYSAAGNDTLDAYQTVTLPAGTYSFSANLEGGDAGDGDIFEIYVKESPDSEPLYTAEGSVTSWTEWTKLEISDIVIDEDNTSIVVGLAVRNATAGVWGAFDDCSLNVQ